ncbi:MAG: hypothetical protein ACPHS0_08525 [bacterium]
MESKSDLNAEFSNAFYRKLENQSSPSWLAKLKMLEGKKGKITFGGIPHKAYWFDLKRNHFSIIVDVLNEVCPHLGPFNKKTIIFQENEESDESKPLQTENPSETFKLKATSGKFTFIGAEAKRESSKSQIRWLILFFQRYADIWRRIPF